MFKWIKKEKIVPIHVFPRDIIVLEYRRTYINSKGKVIKIERYKVLEEYFTKEYIFNEAGIFEFTTMFGFKRGIGGVFGESKTVEIKKRKKEKVEKPC